MKTLKNDVLNRNVPKTYAEFRERLKNKTLPPGFRWSGTTDRSPAARKALATQAAVLQDARAQAALERAGQTITDETGTTSYDEQGNAVNYLPSELADSQEVYAGREYGFQRADDARAIAAEERQRQHDAIQAELDVTDAVKSDKDKGLLPGTTAALTNLNKGLLSIADVAADIGIVPGMTELYKTFAPPGSKYYQEGSLSSKIVNRASALVSPPSLPAPEETPNAQVPPALTPPPDASEAELVDLQVMAKQAYAAQPLQNVRAWTMVQHSPTLTFYTKGGEVVIAVRGTADERDLQADSSITLNRLARSPRYLDDAKQVQAFKFAHPTFTSYSAVGHSLGGAIIDCLLRDGLVQSGVSYNPAIQPADMMANLPNRRIYNEDDPLYQTMGRFATGSEVRKNAKSSTATLANLGLVGFAKHKLDAHGLDNFIGGGYRAYYGDGGRWTNPLVGMEGGARSYYTQRDMYETDDDSELEEPRGETVTFSQSKGQSTEDFLQHVEEQGTLLSEENVLFDPDTTLTLDINFLSPVDQALYAPQISSTIFKNNHDFREYVAANPGYRKMRMRLYNQGRGPMSLPARNAIERMTARRRAADDEEDDDEHDAGDEADGNEEEGENDESEREDDDTTEGDESMNGFGVTKIRRTAIHS